MIDITKFLFIIMLIISMVLGAEQLNSNERKIGGAKTGSTMQCYKTGTTSRCH